MRWREQSKHRPRKLRKSDGLAILLALLFERPKPIGFGLVGIIACWWRYQSRAFLPKMIDATAKLATGE